MQQRLDAASDLSQRMAEAAQDAVNKRTKLAELEADPQFRRFMSGDWSFFQSDVNAKPGESCTALWGKQGTFVALSGPGSKFPGSMVTFFGPDVPKPTEAAVVTVTVDQSHDPSQTVSAINYAINAEYGAISLVLPNVEAALAGMVEVDEFDVSMNRKSVARIGWTGGVAARRKFSQCLGRSGK